VQPDQHPSPEIAIVQAREPAIEQDIDSSSTTSSSSSASSSDKVSQQDPEENKKPIPMLPIFDAPFRCRMQVPHPIPGLQGYFYGPNGSAVYAGDHTLHYGAGGQELTPGKEQANAQLMAQRMGLMGGNVGLGGFHMRVWQQPYWGWM
jgi:hypothetical protein